MTLPQRKKQLKEWITEGRHSHDCRATARIVRIPVNRLINVIGFWLARTP